VGYTGPHMKNDGQLGAARRDRQGGIRSIAQPPATSGRRSLAMNHQARVTKLLLLLSDQLQHSIEEAQRSVDPCTVTEWRGSAFQLKQEGLIFFDHRDRMRITPAGLAEIEARLD
jgi:hypothetical protein